jgi:TPR repeat protein/serine/threonine protein kinase
MVEEMETGEPQRGIAMAKTAIVSKMNSDVGRDEAEANPGFFWMNRPGALPDLRERAYLFKQAADQGNSDGQWHYGECLQFGIGISKDLKGATHFFKLSADQGNSDGQYHYGECLRDGIGISKDLKGATHYFKLSADQGNSDGQYHRAISLADGLSLPPDIETAIHYFKQSAENGSPNGCAAFGWMREHGIGTAMDLETAARDYELVSDQSSNAAAFYGRCCQTGRGVPVDFTVAAEFFQRSANSFIGANSFGCCLERGQGIESDIDRAVQYYRMAGSQSNSAALYNFGRCLEYGKGVQQDLNRAAKYYRLSAELNNAMAENSFGICLEHGIGVHSNKALAVLYYKRSALHGDPDGANNLGFCLEHGRGVKQDIEAAVECYKFARDHGHPEGDLNYRRCLRILDRWDVPDRSSKIADHLPSDDYFFHLFANNVKDPKARPEIIASIERLKSTVPIGVKVKSEWIGGKLWDSSTSKVKLIADSDGKLTALKTLSSESVIKLFQRGLENLKLLNHPLIVKWHSLGGMNHSSAIATEFAGNGSLADHLPGSGNCDLCPLQGQTRTATILVGICIAMQFIHSSEIIHGNLTPDNILLDWDWQVRIAGFGHSVLQGESAIPEGNPDPHYLAPEHYKSIIVPENDVFSFGLILYELIVGRPVFPKDMTAGKIMEEVLAEEWKPDISESLFPETIELISDCLQTEYRRRPSVEEIFDRMEGMNFKLMSGVNASKVTAFVDTIKELESRPADDG